MKRFAVGMVFVRPAGEGRDIQLKLGTCWAASKEEAIGSVLPEVWKELRGYQLNNLVTVEWPDQPTPGAREESPGPKEGPR